VTAAPDNEAARGGHVERFAHSQPDATALSDGTNALSFAQWNERANRLADALEKRGLRARDRVAVRAKNRVEWFVLDAALAKLGALRVAVSFRLAPPEVRYILENSNARAIVFDDLDVAALAPAWAGLADLALRVSFLAPAPAGELSIAELIEDGDPAPRARAKTTEAIHYTSGTTGRPKGVHRGRALDPERCDALARLNADLKRSIPYRKGDRNLLCAPLNHAAAPSSALATHARGGTVYVMEKFDAEQALRLIDRHRISVSFMVPTMLNRIVSLPESTRSRYDVTSLRIITTGASVCPAELKRKVRSYFGPVLYESYGSTETGVITILVPGDQERHADSCGRLLDGVDVRIVDDDGRLLPRGEVGRIFIKSPATIDAYLGTRDLGEDVAEDGYFTAGDVGCLDAEGFLTILDRRKDMIISGGVNIYPAEIEAALREHPAIFDAAAFGIPNADFGEEVRAVCERVPGHQVSELEILAFLKDKLADYKRPRAVTVVDELPRNAAGKILKRDLRAPYWAGTGRAI
jgi:long-chain acyl-CoA synthetase